MAIDLARKNSKEKTVSEIQADPVTQTKWQRKNLPAELSGAQADGTKIFQFNSLTIGKTYKIQGNLNMDRVSGSDTSVLFHVYNGATEVTETGWFDNQNSVALNIPIIAIFTAESTECSVQTTSWSSSNRLKAENRTFVVLEELPNHQETTDWT